LTAAAELRTVWRMLRGLPAGDSHRERLERFYGPQADDYDRFRERLLHGRSELMGLLPLRHGDRLVELGAGTGGNLDRLGPRLAALGSVTLVDMCPALLALARARAALHANVSVVDADAAHYRPAAPVDCVVFSYSLTMIPDWRGALDNAVAMLRPGGALGVVDYYVSPADPAPGLARHGWLTRAVWPLWFRHDGVRLSAEHLPALRNRFDTWHLAERRASLPWVPGARVPYYLFVGRKPETRR
jgi:S-adenosylmethionine-diacylgycerolhomoserine-N-methlytransferase